uniref:DLGP4 protein n=1 Tax=Varanus komodoensis TaxID=61221 RepID=A0A8D2KR61_VARKO
MKGLGDNRSRHLSDNLDSPQDSLYATQDRNPYLLSPTDSYTMDPRFPAPNSLHGDCLLPLNNQISNSSTFPRIHYNSHFEVPDENPFPSHAQATKINRLPANLLDQFEKQLPIHRDGFSTLQFQRSSDSKHRSESPGRIRHLVHSVQKLFAKSQSLEGASKGSMNGKKGAEDSKQNRRSKSKDRAKTTETKRRTRSNISGWWSSDDNLDSDTCNYRNPMGLMTLGRQPDHSQPRYFMHAYNTISEHMLKSSKSNNDLKVNPCTNIPISSESNYIKRGSWSTLTLSHAREMCQKASATIDRALLKSKSCHQDLAYQYLQVGAVLEASFQLNECFIKGTLIHCGQGCFCRKVMGLEIKLRFHLGISVKPSSLILLPCSCRFTETCFPVTSQEQLALAWAFSIRSFHVSGTAAHYNRVQRTTLRCSSPHRSDNKGAGSHLCGNLSCFTRNVAN